MQVTALLECFDHFSEEIQTMLQRHIVLKKSNPYNLYFCMMTLLGIFRGSFPLSIPVPLLFSSNSTYPSCLASLLAQYKLCYTLKDTISGQIQLWPDNWCNLLEMSGVRTLFCTLEWIP